MKRGVLIGIVGLLLLIVCVRVIADTGSNNEEEMEATVIAFPGGLDVTNLNDFPWYGLVITVNETYSNRYYMGDPDRPYMRPDSVVQPNEVESIVFQGNFITEDGMEWENIPFVITAEEIRLEAKTEVNGAYNLVASYTVE